MYSLDILEIVLHLYLQPEIRQLGGATGIDGMYSFFVSGACVGHAKNWQSIQMAHVTICQHLPNGFWLGEVAEPEAKLEYKT